MHSVNKPSNNEILRGVTNKFSAFVWSVWVPVRLMRSASPFEMEECNSLSEACKDLSNCRFCPDCVRFWHKMWKGRHGMIRLQPTRHVKMKQKISSKWWWWFWMQEKKNIENFDAVRSWFFSIDFRINRFREKINRSRKERIRMSIRHFDRTA